jgi:cell wall assembly regulator SMI1
MWHDFVKEICPTCCFHAPAKKDDVAAVEAELKVSLPEELSRLLSESDGIRGDYGLGLVWPIKRISADNLQFRSLHRYLEWWLTGKIEV